MTGLDMALPTIEASNIETSNILESDPFEIDRKGILVELGFMEPHNHGLGLIAYPNNASKEEILSYIKEIGVVVDTATRESIQIQNIDSLLRRSPGKDIWTAVKEYLSGGPVGTVIVSGFEDSSIFTSPRLEYMPSQLELGTWLDDRTQTEGDKEFLRNLSTLYSSWQDTWNESRGDVLCKRLIIVAPLNFHRSFIKANVNKGHGAIDIMYRANLCKSESILDGIFNVYDPGIEIKRTGNQ